jgi:hypothetical protein
MVRGAVAQCLDVCGGEYLDDVQVGGPWTPDQPFTLPRWALRARDETREGRVWDLSLRWARLSDKEA